MSNRFNLSMSELHVMSTASDHEAPPVKTEPMKVLKPTTLPHGNMLPDIEGSGQGEVIPRLQSKPNLCEAKAGEEPANESFSTAELRRNWSNSQTQIYVQETPTGGYFAVFMIALRITFYFAVITIAVALTLAACKFTNVWDPCQYLYVNTTECKVTSYFKGMLYHKDCTEDHYCILPGFKSNTRKEAWTLENPDGNLDFNSPNTNETDTPEPIS